MNESILVSVAYKSIILIDSIFSIFAAGIVIYLFIYKRRSISSIYHMLLNYSFQISLKELDIKIDRLNDFNSDDDEQKETVIFILNEIVGQMRGNPILKKECDTILKKLSKYAENPKFLTEPKKRSVVSELRETLRNINIENYKDMIGENHE